MKLGELVSVAALALAVGSQAEASVVIAISQTGGEVVATGGRHTRSDRADIL
jgi:hypothetical protein